MPCRPTRCRSAASDRPLTIVTARRRWRASRSSARRAAEGSLASWGWRTIGASVPSKSENMATREAAASREANCGHNRPRGRGRPAANQSPPPPARAVEAGSRQPPQLADDVARPLVNVALANGFAQAAHPGADFVVLHRQGLMNLLRQPVGGEGGGGEGIAELPG